MENIQQLNLEPLATFFTENISPSDLAQLLDELLFDYVSMLIQSMQSDSDSVHEQANQFVFHLKTLRDILPECEKV